MSKFPSSCVANYNPVQTSLPNLLAKANCDEGIVHTMDMHLTNKSEHCFSSQEEA